MSEDQKIIEHEGVKYFKEEGQWYWSIGTEWYHTLPIAEDKVPADIKTKKPKVNLQPEILLDIFKILNFVQLLAVQQTSFYFKNFIDKYGKELALNKFNKLEFRPTYEYKWCNGDFVKIEPELNFIEINPHLYDFELSKQLEEKWLRGIEKSIPTFLRHWYEDIDIVVCELEQNYDMKKELYYIQLPNFPKNIEEMKIVRYVFQLLFNCTFKFFKIHLLLINPQMIQLLFDENETNMPLQIHSQKTEKISLWYEIDCLNFIWNHLISNQIIIYVSFTHEEDIMDVYSKILANGGNKFLNVTYECLNSLFYFYIIKHIETSEDISKMVKRIKFVDMYGPLIRENNIKIKFEEYAKPIKFQLSNKYNPKIKFSVTIKKSEEQDESYYEYPNGDVDGPIVDAVIKRIN